MPDKALIRVDCEIVDGLKSKYGLWEWSANNSARFINPVYWRKGIADALDKYPCSDCPLDRSCMLKEDVKGMTLHDEPNLSGVRAGLNEAFKKSDFKSIPNPVRIIIIEGIQYQA